MARRVDPVARRRAIAAQAMKLFSQVGYDAVTLSLIASEAQLARTVLYRHFRSKREVLDEAIRGDTRFIMDSCRQIADGTGRAEERLAAIGVRVIDALFEKRDDLVSIFDFVLAMARAGEDMGQKVVEFTVNLRRVIRELLECGRREGSFEPSLNVESTAESLFSQFESTALRIVLGIENDPSAAASRFRASVAALVA